MKTATITILNGINGEFRAGQLTAIIGASGSGKSTLLDLLTGSKTGLANGTITFNGHQCENPNIVYIMQNCELHMHITVWEAMYFSINLKVGEHMKNAEKTERVSSKIFRREQKKDIFLVIIIESDIVSLRLFANRLRKF